MEYDIKQGDEKQQVRNKLTSERLKALEIAEIPATIDYIFENRIYGMIDHAWHYIDGSEGWLSEVQLTAPGEVPYEVVDAFFNKYCI